MRQPKRPIDNEGVQPIRSLLAFLERTVRSAIEDYELTRRNRGSIIYLLDFSEIYSYVYPNVRPAHRSAPLPSAAPTIARDLFDNVQENIAFPLGTLAEIAHFLRRVARGVETIDRVALSSNLEEAFGDMEAYFKEDHLPLLSYKMIESAKDDHLATMRQAILRLLQDYSVGLTDLYNLLRHEKTFDLASFIRQNPTPMRLTHYHSILKSLSEQRDPHGSKFANQTDAYNLSLLIDINRLSQDSYKTCGQPALSLFRLLTATNTIYRLDRKRDVALHLQPQAGEGSAFDLLETPRGLHTKRFLFHMAETQGISILRELLVETVRARATLDQLSDNLHDVDSSLEEIISLLPEPKEIISDQLFRSAVGGLLKLESFLTRYQSLTQQLITREMRHDLIPRPSGDERVEFQHLAGQSIATLRNLISSIASTAENFGYLDEITFIRDKASKVWRNQLLSLRHLGYRILIENRPSSRRWKLFRIDNDSDILAIDIYENATVVSWPSQFPASFLLTTVGHHIANTSSDNQRVDLEVIDWNGAERSLHLAARELHLSDSELSAAAFVRLTFGPVTLAAELFCSSPGYQLRTGIVTVNLDPTLTLEFFFALTTCRTDFLLKRILWKELVALATAPPEPHTLERIAS